MESELHQLRADFQKLFDREIKETEDWIDSVYHNTVHELHSEASTAAKGKDTPPDMEQGIDNTELRTIDAITPTVELDATTIPKANPAPRQNNKKKESWTRRSPPPLLKSLDSSATSPENDTLSSPSTPRIASIVSPITPLRVQSPAHIFNLTDFPPLPTVSTEAAKPQNKINNLQKNKGGKAKRKTKHLNVQQFGLSNPSPKANGQPNINPNRIETTPPETAVCSANTLLIGDGAVRGIHLENTITRYYCGGTINTITHVLPHILLQYPQCHSVIVHVGANDVLRGHPPAKIERDFGDLIELVRRHNRILYLSGPFPRPGGNSDVDFQITGRLLHLSQFLAWKAQMRPSSLGGFTGHYHTHWEMPWLFKENGSLNKQGKFLLQNNIRNSQRNTERAD